MIYLRLLLACFGLMLAAFYESPRAAFGQPFTIEWSGKPGGGIGLAAYLTPVKAGGYAVATCDDSTHTGPEGMINQGHPLALTRLNADGSVVWRRLYEHDLGLGELRGVVELEGGDLFVFGSAYNTKKLTRLEDFWVARFDSTGEELWSSVYGGSRIDIPSSAVGTPDGGCVVVGWTMSTDGDVKDQQGGGSNGTTPSDVWLLKLRRDGELEWQRCVGGTKTDHPNEVYVTSSGDIVFGGYTMSVDGDIDSSNGKTDLWLVKLNSSGTILWSRCYGLSRGVDCWAMCSTASSGYLLVGWTVGIANCGGSNGALWTIQVDSNGKLLKEACHSVRAVWPAAITQAADKSFLMVGWVDSGMTIPQGYHGGGADGWLCKLDSNGNFLWDELIGGSRVDQFKTIHAAGEDSYILSGRGSSSDQDLAGLDAKAGGWVLKLREREVSAVPALGSAPRPSELRITPNPANSYATLSLDGQSLSDASVEVFDVLGKRLISVSTPREISGELRLDLKDLRSGAYLVRVRTELGLFEGGLTIDR